MRLSTAQAQDDTFLNVSSVDLPKSEYFITLNSAELSNLFHLRERRSHGEGSHWISLSHAPACALLASTLISQALNLHTLRQQSAL